MKIENKYRIEVGTDSHQVIQFLEDRIYEHNSTAIDKDDGRLFSRIVRDENNQVIAGIAGWTWARVCEITQLWVNEKVRGLGVGKILLEAAEEEAKNRDCLTILVKSYSFQAPHFYERYGYQVEHIMYGFPQGYRYYTLAKKIG
jgi:ribosomal protein S18 acetylase RimI-like enzyme